MRTSAVIPIKQLENAKQRLASILNTGERNQLFRTMVEDVLTTTEACTLVDEIIVVTSDDVVAELALSFGAEILSEPEHAGLIPAVTKAAGYLADNGIDIMLFLPGDVPLVTPEELEIVLEGFGRQDKPEFMIVPASDLGGSNCIACSPPDCMEFGFGEDSFRRHLGIARKLGIEPSVAKLPGIGLDVDTPDDLVELASILVESRIESYTHRYFRESGILERISEELLRIS
ncbi:MAG: 2-phospho-L-lactate guanylyltransferase [Gammaproteobacteria bacterium]|nr:2-phospho-L-lactate guanylyltransferase [Gammaproteobacteria bacterium]